ncbi:MAG: hypothetical protein WC595_00675 [Candidatus Nanoarchaeia archaeon]
MNTHSLTHAEKALFTAHHLLTITYPLSGENKLFIPIIRHLHTAYLYSIRSFTTKHSFNQFVKKHKVSKEILTTQEALRELLEHYTTSTITFSRKENYILCDMDYNLQTINPSLLHTYLRTTQEFIQFLKGVPC